MTATLYCRRCWAVYVVYNWTHVVGLHITMIILNRIHVSLNSASVVTILNIFIFVSVFPPRRTEVKVKLLH
ncbi:hypothetical protein BD769DRAFT_1500719, partial [Suillus cothurnatus]